MGSHFGFYSIFVVLLFSTIFGSLQSYADPISTSLRKIYPELNQHTNEWQWFNNFPRFTASLGSFIFYPLVYRFGRQIMISIGAFVNAIFYLLILAANENRMTYILTVRLLHGLIWGFMSAITLVYLYEIVDSSHYGFAGCMHQFFIVIGICLDNILAAYTDYKIMSIVLAIISICSGSLIWIIDDSPQTLKDNANREARTFRKNQKLKKNDQNEKKKLQKNIKKSSDDLSTLLLNEDEKDALSEKEHNKDKSNEKKENNHINTTVIYKKLTPSEIKLNIKYVILAIIHFFFQQFMGSNAILSNLNSIMQSSGLNIDSNLQSLMVNAAQLVSVFVLSLIIDYFGPRVMWCISCAFIIIILAIYAATRMIEFPNFVPVLLIFIYRLSWGFGGGPLTYAVWVQLYFDSARLSGTMAMMAGHWIWSWLVVYTYNIFIDEIGEFYTVLIYVFCTIGSFLFGLFCIPDNKHIENEENALI